MTDRHRRKLTPKPPMPSPAAATTSPSRKRLLTNSKRKLNSSNTTPSPQSSLSSNSSTDQTRKKTRELPNLSDCHGCGLRINYTNPRERLRTLDSVWRIVLLCKECFKQVECDETCSYCFGKTSGLDCFRCGDCGRLIHKDCVMRYGKSPPWSYCHRNSQFSVCVDCWVPDLLVNSVGVCRRGRSRIKKRDDSGILESNNDSKMLEDAVKEADCVLEKKFQLVAKAKEDALKKAMVAKNAVAFANDVLEFVSKKSENSGKSKCLEDVELALQLHRAMNSSPRIAKNFCSMKLSCLNARQIGNTGVCGRIGVCADNQLNEMEDRTLFEHSICNSTEVKAKECYENGEIGMVKVVGECNSGITNRLNSVLKYYLRRNNLRQKPHSEINRSQGVRDSTLRFYSRRNQKRDHDRYLLKYRRRTINLKEVSNGETTDLCNGLLLNNKITSPRLPLNCSKVPSTISDSPQPSSLPPQGFACASGSSGDLP